MCLATKPRVLLLDEPLAGMGAEETERMLGLLANLKATHAILLVEHDMDAVFRIADRITVMVNGTVIATGDPASIRVNPEVRTAYLGEEHLRCCSIEGLNTYYGDSHILRGVDVAMPAATSVGLLGRNGMGKTTLIRSLMGYVRPASGRVKLDGNDVTGWAPEKMARRGIGYVPEGRGIFPNLSVRENLVMSARAPASTASAHWTFDRVMTTFPRLTERLSHGGQQLSGGEQQMLSIGRALMTNPRLLILDEATEGLAPLIVAEIWRVIGEIRATGIATLIVDRDWRKVLGNTDQAVVMEKGKIVRQGPSAGLLAEPKVLEELLGV